MFLTIEVREQYNPLPSNLKLGMNTFSWNLQLSTLRNLDLFDWFVPRAGGNFFDLVDNVVAFQHLTKDHVTSIEPAVLPVNNCCIILHQRSLPSDDGGDEELRAIGVLARVRHAQQALLGVLQLKVLIFKLVSIDGLSTSAISSCKVTSLDHEVLDDSMKG